MRYLLTVVLVVYLFSGLLFPRTEPGQNGCENPGDFSGKFVLVEDTPLRIFIDTGWERNGNIPMFLVFNDLKIMRGIHPGNLSGVINTGNWLNEILGEDISLSLVTYEKNPLRTRMKLIDKSKTVKFKINGEEGQAEVYVGESPLKLGSLRVKFTVIVPDELYELRFMGSDVRVYHRKTFIFVPSGDAIYTVSHGDRISAVPSDLENNKRWNVWAVKIKPGNENAFIGENRKER
ncbi:MAG TPA: hypothetical protein VK469_13240 [Candidatus Kapabacteria bacterium]|nr:hypothetical protein [Candidatus Kapabacteria bacterium]